MPFNSPFSAITALQRRDHYPLATNEATDATSGTTAVGQFRLNASSFPTGTSFAFTVVFSVSSGSLTGTCLLYNLTDAELVTGTNLTTSSTASDAQSVSLTVGSGVGELKEVATIYEVRLLVSGSLVTDIVSLGSARLLIL